MILYLDSSALVKLYAEEAGTTQVQSDAVAAKLCATSELTYVEARSAIARKRREDGWSETEYRRILRALDDDWPTLHHIAVTPSLVRRAADFTDRFGLRAYDAVQLAAAEAVQEQVGRKFRVRFCCFDGRLTTAAERLSLQGHGT